jgi:hypothetical protein
MADQARDELREQVRSRYARAAQAVLAPQDGSYVGCIAGALSRAEYLDGLRAAGFAAPSVSFTADAAPGLRAAVIRAVKPGA